MADMADMVVVGVRNWGGEGALTGPVGFTLLLSNSLPKVPYLFDLVVSPSFGGLLSGLTLPTSVFRSGAPQSIFRVRMDVLASNLSTARDLLCTVT